MSESSAKISIGGISTTIEVVTFLAEQWAKHKADEQGISIEEALAQAEENYKAAQSENNDLKNLGHE